MTSPAIKMLYHEHDVILKAVEKLNSIIEDERLDLHEESLSKLLGFFKEYGHNYHHKKEETVLFPLLFQKSETLGLTMVEALKDHHDSFAETLEQLSQSISSRDWDKVRIDLKSYLSDLQDHISAENDELFVTAETLLDEAETEKVYFDFMDLDMESGQEKKTELENRVLQNTFE